MQYAVGVNGFESELEGIAKYYDCVWRAAMSKLLDF